VEGKVTALRDKISIVSEAKHEVKLEAIVARKQD
jgi:hypothetical protein